ncbi:fng [Bugula neritina]|uniref:Fng n=1 Tax=Bugula neritina TaxID=10212 RepID=A0A7J7KHJ7_BUGNE|nr:fng [Bugula neritina]
MSWYMQVHLVTDGEDTEYARLFGQGANYLSTKCDTKGAIWKREMCTVQAIFNLYVSKLGHFKWFCLVQDNTYVNVPMLVHTLRRYNYHESWYLGRRPVYSLQDYNKDNITFQYATENSGICILGLQLE